MRHQTIALFILALVVVACVGCAESSFKLSPESRLPKWLELPGGVPRADVYIDLDYYIFPSNKAVFTMRDRTGRKLKSVTVPLTGTSPQSLKPRASNEPVPYPSYEVCRAAGLVDIIEHRRMEPVFYMTDDALVWKALVGPK